MSSDCFDAVVVGSGPAGSLAALRLARGGAHVALVDKTMFPRDKACGDLVGPRGLSVLAELGIEVPAAERVGDMVLVGPTCKTALLPAYRGETYPGHGFAVPRYRLDAMLRDTAIAAGGEPVTGRVVDIRHSDGDPVRIELASGRHLRGDVVIGADGAQSGVAAGAGLVEATRVLWGFAVSAYVDVPVRLPHIVLWEPEPWRLFPGYGWLFPGADGSANLGLGLGLLVDRSGAGAATRKFPAFLDHLVRLGLVDRRPASPLHLRGGWLKMGIVGTTPARERTLLVGDAAGLVNPLQGEGISQAMISGGAAAEAVLAGPGTCAARYRALLAATYASYYPAAAELQSIVLKRPKVGSILGRVLTAPGLPEALRGGWSIYWNDLLAGASSGPARGAASALSRAGRALTASGSMRLWFAEQLR